MHLWNIFAYELERATKKRWKNGGRQQKPKVEARGEGGGEGNIKEKGKYERRRGERREREGKEGEERREKPHSKNILDEYWNELLYILYMMSVLNYTVCFVD